jgi:hypothetical protein
MLYLALFPQQASDYLRTEWFENAPNRLVELVPKAGRWASAIKVIEAGATSGEKTGIFLDADAFKQKVICYIQR